LRALAKQPRAVLHQNSVLGCFTSLAMTICLVRFLKMAKLQYQTAVIPAIKKSRVKQRVLGAFEKKIS
jgi:hypothetical protein